MNGPFGNGFPYTNFHELNMDWIIRIAKDFLDQYTHIQDIISSGETSLSNLTTASIEALQAEKTRLEGLLNAWYTEHSEDIAGQLTQAISDFQTAAEAIGADVIASIPADYSALTTKVDNLKTELTQYETKQLPRTIIENSYINIEGVITAYAGWDRTDYIPVSDYALITAKSSVASDYNVFYDSTKTKICAFKVYTTDKVYQVPDNAAYVIFSNTAAGMENFVATYETKAERNARESIKFLDVNKDNIVNSHFNMVDLCSFVDGYVYTYLGNKTESATTSIATPIRIKSGKTYYAKNIRLYSDLQNRYCNTLLRQHSLCQA